MKKTAASIFFTFAFFFAKEGLFAETAVRLTERYQAEKSRIVDADQKAREVMGVLYRINRRMKNMSKKRDILNNKMIGAEGDVQTVARSVSALQEKLRAQRSKLSRRLRVMYMLGGDVLARALFSSSNAQELDQNLKYLRIISERDFDLIKSYRENLVALNEKREKLHQEVKKLVSYKNSLKKQEELLSKDQIAKSHLLATMKSEREVALKKIANIREMAEGFMARDLLNVSFFEKRGDLPSPIRGDLKHRFGFIENETYHYRLSHKGLFFEARNGTEVRSIFEGRVAFVGHIEGYGQTIILDHGDHYYTVYARAGEVQVREGQHLAARAILAKSQGELYFEIRHFSDAIDPAAWIKNI